MIHHDSDLFFGIYNIKNEFNQRQALMILNYFDIYF